MPDKRKSCGNGCLRCWRNKLKHGNKHAKHMICYEIDIHDTAHEYLFVNKPIEEMEPISNHMIRRINRAEKRKLIKEKQKEEDNIVCTNKWEITKQDIKCK